VRFPQLGFVPAIFKPGDAVAKSHGVLVDERQGGEAYVQRAL